MDKVSLTIMGTKDEYKKGISLEEIANSYQSSFQSNIICAKVNNDLQELSTKIYEDSQIEFLDLTNPDSMRIYQRSVSFLLICASKDVLKDCEVFVEHSIGGSFYCEIIKNGLVIDETIVKKIEARMHELVKENIAFEKISIDKQEAIKIFTQKNMADKVNTLKYKKASIVNLYKLNDYYDYFYGYMVPSTKYLDKFSLSLKLPGVVLNMPSTKTPTVVNEFMPLEKLTQIFQEFSTWGKILNVGTVSDVNEVICKGEMSNLIRVSEALQEKKIANIADMIYQKRDKVGVVLIAGPSSSGKTTFAHRLCVQIQVNGMKPYPISLDDYYVNRELTPKDENGDYDFEALEAIDIELFNKDLSALLKGETVELPTFNFKTGKREYKGNFVKLGENEILVIEGIHGLNEKLTKSISKENKFKIYISALTQLNIDNHNRIPTTDTRIIRRIVRDNQFRGFNAAHTISLWPSVRRGEEKNIFPFQEQADIMFNSSLIYELFVLKQYVEPLLFQIDESMPQYSEAKRLLKFLDYFLCVPSDNLPNNSIMREFVGGSCFKV